MDQKIEPKKLNTKNLCFLCLKATQLKIIKKKVTIVSGDESKIKPAVSLTCLLRHLKILSIQLEPEIKADLCSDCEWVVTRLSDLFQQYQNLQPDLKNKSLLGKLQMELNYYLEKMFLRISNGEKNHKLFHRYTTEMAKDPESTSQLEWIDKLRKDISDKCSKIRFNPTVEIMELLRLEMEIRNKPVPKDEKVVGVEKEIDRSTLKPTFIETSGQTEDQSTLNEIQNQKVTRDLSTYRLYCKSCKKSFRHYCSARIRTPVYRQQRRKCHKMLAKKKPERYFKFQCSTCGKRFPMLWWLRLHEKADHPSKKVKTSSDPHEISDSDLPNNISKKMTATGGDEDTDSSTCLSRTSCKADKNANKIFTTASNQKYYRDLSTGLLCCSICDKSFNFPFAVYKHQNSCHQSIQKDLEKEKPENGYKLHCLTCDKRFPAMWDLYRHQKVFHPDSRSFKCDICNKTFETVGEVKMHKHVVQRNKEKGEHSSHFTGTSAQAEKSTQTESFNLADPGPNCHSSQAQTQTDPQSQLTVESANNWIINPVTNQLTPMKVYPEVYLFSSSNSLTNTCPIQAFPVQLDSSTISSNNLPDLSLSNYFIQQAIQSLDNERAPATDSSNENSYVLSISEF